MKSEGGILGICVVLAAVATLALAQSSATATATVTIVQDQQGGILPDGGVIGPGGQRTTNDAGEVRVNYE